MGRKIFVSSVIFLFGTILLVLGTYDTLIFFSYQNLGNVPAKNTLFLTFILKQYFVFYKTVLNSLQFFDIIHNNQLKLITLLYQARN